jgi:RNA polymerase sigma-70 factor (ECF subfamily)
MTSAPANCDAGGHGREDREQAILRELRAGDRRNLGRLVDRYGEELMGYLTAILGRREAAEDAFQETWVKVMERIDRHRPGRAFAPWLFRIARNGAYDRLRRARRWRWFRLGPARDDEPAHEPVAPGDTAGAAVARSTADALLKHLDPGQRELLWMRYRSELSYEEIAAALALPVGTVKSRVSRALHRLAREHARMEDAARG